MTGAVQSLRLKYKSKVNYNGKFAVIHTSGLKSDPRANREYRGPPKDHEYIAILNLEVFLDLFAEPETLAAILTKKGQQLVATWMEKNSNPRMQGKRRPNSVTYNLAEYEWRGGRGSRQEKSIYTLQLSTYHFTINHQQDARPEISLNDVKVITFFKS
jgi:hypothetical protein